MVFWQEELWVPWWIFQFSTMVNTCAESEQKTHRTKKTTQNESIKLFHTQSLYSVVIWTFTRWRPRTHWILKGQTRGHRLPHAWPASKHSKICCTDLNHHAEHMKITALISILYIWLHTDAKCPKHISYTDKYHMWITFSKICLFYQWNKPSFLLLECLTVSEDGCCVSLRDPDVLLESDTSL